MGIFGNRRQTDPEPQETPEQRLPQPPQPALAPPQPIGFETVIGTNSSIEGKFVSSSNIRIDGTFSGTLEISGNILVGETARINADINAKNISIAGAVRGNVSGKKVQLLRTGRIWGDITATALTTEEGAFIDGKISMVSHEAANAATPTALFVPSMVEAAPADGTQETVAVVASDDAADTMSSHEDEPDFLSPDEDLR